FNKNGVVAKIFDITDYRSVASTALRTIPQSHHSTFASLVNLSVNSFTHLLSGLASIFTQRTFAAETSYEYGFPMYGIPSSVLDDPALEDPFDNAERIVQEFKKGNYIDKAKNCFGVRITEGPHGWEAITEDDPN